MHGVMGKYQALNEFLRDYALKFAPPTITLYNSSIRWFFEHCPLPLEELRASHITDWVLSLQNKGLSPATQGSYLRGVKSFFRYLHEENILPFNPAEEIKYPKIPLKMPNYLERKDYLRFVKLTEGKPLERALVETLYCTGLRSSEIVNVEKSQINWDERLIHITVAKGKHQRIVLFTARCGEILKDYLATRTDENPYLFVNKTGEQLTENVLQGYFRQLSKEFGRRVTPHTLRHTFAVTLFLKGLDIEKIQILMGHVEIKHTLYYARLFNATKEELYADYL